MLRLLALFASLSAILSASAADLIPLKLDLPKPLFVGTPRPLQVANLEPTPIGPRPAFMVPAGTVLLSKGKPVTASDSLPVIGELSYITDGEKSGVEGTYVELGPGVQWVQIDLGATAKLAAVVVWHFHSQARVYHGFVVQTSNDPEFKKDITTLYNADVDNLDGLGKGKDFSYVETYQGRIVDAKGAVARYVRLYSNGNTSDELNHYTEVEVYGEPVK